MKNNYILPVFLILCSLGIPKSSFCFEPSFTSFTEAEARQKQLKNYRDSFKSVVLKNFQENMNPEKWTLVVDNGDPQHYVYYPLTFQEKKGSKPDFGVFVPQLFYSSFYQLINHVINTKDTKDLDTELENWVIQDKHLAQTQSIDPFTTRLCHVRDESAVIFLGNRLSAICASKTREEGKRALLEQEAKAKRVFAEEIVKGFQKGIDTQAFFIEVDGQRVSYQFYPLHSDPLKITKQPLFGFGFSPSDEIVRKTTEDDELGVFIPSEIYGAFLDCFSDYTCLLDELENWNIYEKLSSNLKCIHLSAQHKKRKDLVLFLCPLKNIFIK